MKPVTQTRTGDRGNCFAAALASIFETPLPEFGLTEDEGYDANVDKWLAKRGWQYTQTDDTSTPPIGHHTIEGISPRGGMHATVGLNGKMVWDPHPEDGTGHGLVKIVRYGLLTPLGAKDTYEPRQRKSATATWRRTASGDWLSPDSCWKIRGPIFGKPMYWVYHDGGRYTPTGKYDDVVHFTTVAMAKKFIESMGGGEAKDSVTLRPDRDGEYALQYDAEPITTSKFVPGVGFHGGKVSAKSGKVVVKLDGKKIGEAGVKYEAGAWRITTLAVEPSLVGKGYGKYLYAELIRTAAENGVKELRSCSATNRSPGSEHAWNRLKETHGAVNENGTWRVKAKDVMPIPLRKGRT
jgi:GNAT superfamily N-acetyltransferase